MLKVTYWLLVGDSIGKSKAKQISQMEKVKMVQM